MRYILDSTLPSQIVDTFYYLYMRWCLIEYPKLVIILRRAVFNIIDPHPPMDLTKDFFAATAEFTPQQLLREIKYEIATMNFGYDLRQDYSHLKKTVSRREWKEYVYAKKVVLRYLATLEQKQLELKDLDDI